MIRRALTPGLRMRMLAALALTSAVTLGVAALALLGPLESRVRSNATSSLLGAALTARNDYYDAFTRGRRLDLNEIATISRALARRLGARVALVDASGARVFDTDYDVVDPFDDARRALAGGHAVRDVGHNRLRAAVPLRIAGHRYVLVLRKQLDFITSSIRVVRNAFLEAAAAGLGIALLLSLALSTRLLRRLERLRDSARDMEAQGPEAPAPVDHGRDEIGELARAFAAMQSRLRRQEAARRAFVATASHELRTPLTSLDGMLELLDDDLQPPMDIEDARERLARAREQSQRLSRLASDLLDLSRIDAALELRSEPVELNEISRAVVAEFERRARDGSHPLELSADGPVWALGDPGSLARIVRILLDNALKASPVGAPVHVEVADAGGRATVAVSDHGPGVDPQDRELIFERFQRGSTASGQGFGLGLAIGRELAVRMDGSLTLSDAGARGGARFVLEVPGDPDGGGEDPSVDEPVPTEPAAARSRA